MSACGGTHVSRTGAIGMIAIAGVERFKGGQRVEFVCGGRALRAYRGLKASVSGGVRLLSVLPEDLPAAIEKLQSAARAQQKAQEGLQERLAVHEAAALAAKGQKIGSVTLVAEALARMGRRRAEETCVRDHRAPRHVRRPHQHGLSGAHRCGALAGRRDRRR